MSELEVRIPMEDGVELAATLYLPTGPAPCLLEALPYRKDDVTSDRAEYRTLRDRHGYAVCRLDLRGTGSSGGRATDEYPASEQDDLVAVIAWLAAQPWCDGGVGMYGTSYSGFNSLQVAMRRPPALRAIVACYSTDDRYTDDVHRHGGSVRLLDLVDYCHYMTPLNALPPVPALWPGDWRAEWADRIAEHEPWLLTWMDHQRDDAYWRHGSLDVDYAAIACPTMILAGWADGYRNNTFRTMAALGAAGTSRRLLVGPWAHADPAVSAPGPRIDGVTEMARWFDRWLRGAPAEATEPEATWFVRHRHVPGAAREDVPGHWRRDTWPPTAPGTVTRVLDARPPYPVRADVGLAAWSTCAAHLPWGQPGDQRADDAAALTWDSPAESVELTGNATVRLTVSADVPVAGVAVRLCDVAPDGTSTLVTRGWRVLTRRDGVEGGGFTGGVPLVPGEPVEVDIELEATAYRFGPDSVLRVAVAGADWPNTVVPPGPSTLTVHGGTLTLPVVTGPSPYPAPVFAPGNATSGEDPSGVVWRTEHDVLGRTTAAVTSYGGEFTTPYGSGSERYDGRVTVELASHDQSATARTAYRLRFDAEAVEVSVVADLAFTATADTFDLGIELLATEQPDGQGPTEVARRSWTRSYPRDLA